MTFLVRDDGRRLVCRECGQRMTPGQAASFAFSVYRHAICPVEEVPEKLSEMD